MEDSVQGSAIILPSPPRGSPPSTIIPRYIVRIYRGMLDAPEALRDVIESVLLREVTDRCEKLSRSIRPIVRLWEISIGGGHPHVEITIAEGLVGRRLRADTII